MVSLHCEIQNEDQNDSVFPNPLWDLHPVQVKEIIGAGCFNTVMSELDIWAFSFSVGIEEEMRGF